MSSLYWIGPLGLPAAELTTTVHSTAAAIAAIAWNAAISYRMHHIHHCTVIGVAPQGRNNTIPTFSGCAQMRYWPIRLCIVTVLSIWAEYINYEYPSICILSFHHSGAIMSAMASQITGVSIVCSTICSDTGQRKHQSSASLAVRREIHRWPFDSLHKGPVMRKMFRYDDVIISWVDANNPHE